MTSAFAFFGFLAPEKRPLAPRCVRSGLILAWLVAQVGCASTTTSGGSGTDSQDADGAANPGDSAESDSGLAGRDVGTSVDAGGVGPSDAGGPMPGIDSGGSPSSACGLPPVRRLACLPSSGLANKLPLNEFGALEAELVAVLPPGTKGGGCAADSAHVHLQVDVNGDRYDIAIDNGGGDSPQQMFIYETTLPASLPAEGWSSSAFSYTTDLGVHSSDFTQMSTADVSAKLVSDLANVSRLTIHGLSYTDGTGAHDVHYEGTAGHCGVLLLHGQGDACGDKAVALRFTSDSF